MHSDSLAFHVSVLRKQFAAHCRERLAGEGITLSQLYILICVGRRENISPRAVSEIMGLDAGYLTRALAGLITQEKNPRDRRAAVLNLTERGRGIFDFSRRLFREWDEIALAPLSGEERQTLLNLMAKVTARRLPGEGRPGEDRPGWMQPAEMEED